MSEDEQTQFGSMANSFMTCEDCGSENVDVVEVERTQIKSWGGETVRRDVDRFLSCVDCGSKKQMS